MTPYELIDLLLVACSVLLIWAIVATLSLFRERKEQKKATTEEAPDVVTPNEIAVKDKDWYIRTSLVERLRRQIVKGLASSPVYFLAPWIDDIGIKLSKREEYELFMPFLKKGYFIYLGEEHLPLCTIMQYRITKHRDYETTALEITEELLTKNVQL